MLLTFEDGQRFSDGACQYLYRPIDGETTSRIFLQVGIDHIQTQAAIDTGGVYLFCDPETADLLNLDRANSLESIVIQIRGIQVRGDLHRVLLTLSAEEGENLIIDATAFIPGDEMPNLPTILGMHCCLERLRFAVDPTTQSFYFGTHE